MSDEIHNCDRCGAGVYHRPKFGVEVTSIGPQDWDYVCGTCLDQIREAEQVEVKVTTKLS